MEEGKLTGLSVTISNAQGAQTMEWQAAERINLTDWLAQRLTNREVFDILGGGHMQSGNLLLPGGARTLNADGLLDKGAKSFERNYGIERNPARWNREANHLKKILFNLEQTDKTTTRAILWNADVSKMTKKELQGAVSAIFERFQEKFQKPQWSPYLQSAWGENLSGQDWGKLDWSNGLMKLSGTLQAPDGGMVKDIYLTFDEQGNFRAQQGTKVHANGRVELMGKSFTDPQVVAGPRQKEAAEQC